MSGVENLPALRAAVVARLREKIPGVTSIEPHGGTFDETELRKFALLAPAIRVACMGFDSVERHATGMLRLPVHFAAVVITRDRPDTDRDTQAMLIANAVTLAVYGHRFGLEGVYQPEGLRGANEYSATLQSAGVAMWQVVWTSPVLIGESIEQAIHALSQIIINGVVFADPLPTGADPSDGAP